MQKPAVDVIIPAYNAREFIVQAIESVKSQTYPAKTIVVDDGSTDLTDQVIKETFGDDQDVTYIHTEHRGPSSARNRGLAAATADFIAFLDADDVWLPNKLSEQLEVFQRSMDPKLGVVYCDFEQIDRSDRLLSNYPRVRMDLSVRGDVFGQLLRGNYVTGSASGVLVKRECFKIVGGFDENMPFEDWDMWLRLARYYHFDYVERPLVQLRRHSNNRDFDSRHTLTGNFIFFKKWATEAFKRPTVLSAWIRQLASRKTPEAVLQLTSEFFRRQLGK
jgi:glycosyltransferase involved in cell wall biosynthesis